MAPLPLAVLSLLGTRSTEPTALAAVFIALAFGLRFLRYRGRGRRGGPWGGGPGNSGGRPPEDAPMQWDIRKPAQEPTQQSDGATSEEHNPPSDL